MRVCVCVCKIPQIDHRLHSFEIADNNFTFIALLLQFKQLQPLVRGVYKYIGGETEAVRKGEEEDNQSHRGAA